MSDIHPPLVPPIPFNHEAATDDSASDAVAGNLDTLTPLPVSETSDTSCKLTNDGWEEAIKTMNRFWPTLFRFTRAVSDDGTTVTIWVPKWSALDSRFDENERTFESARKEAEGAIGKVFDQRKVVFWRAGEYCPSDIYTAEPGLDDGLDMLSEHEAKLEKVIRPYFSRSIQADLKSLILGTRSLDLSIGAGTRVIMFSIEEYVGMEQSGYRYKIQNTTNIILSIIQSVGLEIVSIDRTCMTIDIKHLMHHVSITYC